jgi:hypothetical protein
MKSLCPHRFAIHFLMGIAIFLCCAAGIQAQETTAGLQGTVKDHSGAVVPHAHISVTSPTLVGTKETETDASGYYRLANLPPGTYALTVKVPGFETLLREGLNLEVGHLPTVDFSLEVGTVSTVVEVTSAAPLIDTTTNTTLTNIPEDVIKNVPRGRSFQSVIEFAPSARNEPLAGNTVQSNGTGGSSPGSTTNGSDHGFSVAGGADSENSYLVEGQETANIIGGYSHTNVPFDFIQEVQLKTSGVEAEHGGSLGGVVNVIMNKGSNKWHGSIFAQFENDSLDGSPTANSRYDPGATNTTTSWGAIDPTYQNYQPIRPHTSDTQPGFTFGGPIWKDRIFGTVGFDPEFNNYERKIAYATGTLPYSQNTQTYYTYARLDVAATQRIRVFGSWLYQQQRQSGENLPTPDSVQSYVNPSTGCFGAATTAGKPCSGDPIPFFVYGHNLGFSAPNSTTNAGVDWTISNSLVSTSRFGYYFENYHDFGYPTTGTILNFASNGVGNTEADGKTQLPSNLQELTGFVNLPNSQNYTLHNANKAVQLDEDIAWYKSGWAGTHNFKFGYQLNRLSNDIDQHYNTPYVQVWPGAGTPYFPQGPVGQQNCATPGLTVTSTTIDPTTGLPVPTSCEGTYGTVDVYDYGSLGKATSYNHALFAQDSWQIGHGFTINAGIRVEKENLPAENQPAGNVATPINFSWSDKIAPRIGVAWDPAGNGKFKIFGSYGVFYDQMKLNLAISSFGGQYWQECWYALQTSDLSVINPAFNSGGRFCSGPNSASEANFAGGTTPAGLVFLENLNERAFPTTCPTCSATEEGVAPGLKPYEQHESVYGFDYQIARNLAVEARWDRRRLDHVIEDSAIFNPDVGETFVIVNPGQGVNKTFSSFYNFLYPTAPLDCSTTACPPNQTIPAARSYDGIEIRLTKATSNHWMGMFSYTYSYFRGNYTGLTSTDVADGGGGRNAPNNSRSFDEPYFSWNSMGGSSSGLLPTDRPNGFKGYAYYDLPWFRKFTTDFGIFQTAYSGTPLTSYTDVGLWSAPGAFPQDVVNRGKWIDVGQDNSTGVISISQPYTKRTPWYTQTDFNIQQGYKVTESKNLSFTATFTNLLNQHSVVSDGQQIDSSYAANYLTPGGNALTNGPAFYSAAMRPYNLQQNLNNSASGDPVTTNSQYGKPYLYQLSRNIRLAVKFTF